MEGLIVRIISEKRFGFIRTSDAKEYFFHRDDTNGFFEQMMFDFERGRKIKVTFESVPSEKGLRAGNVIELLESY